MNELIPTGKLRVGLAVAPALSALFVVKDKDGTPRGVPVDLANELATQLGAPVEFMLAPNTGELTDALEAGTIDVSFMPVDDERRKRIDFGPIYFLVESTYLATEVSGIKSAEEVDRPGIRVVGIANTTTIRAAARSLKHTTVQSVQSVGEAVAMLASGKADAFALSRDSLPPFAKMLPGSRITTGGFQLTGIAIAVPKSRPAALATVTKFMEKAKHFRHGTPRARSRGLPARAGRAVDACRAGRAVVIPGHAEGVNPESRRLLRAYLWIPGSHSRAPE
jgi:polar amino acid transport system substrate-binding protein